MSDVSNNDKREIRAGPVFERISNPDDAKRYNYGNAMPKPEGQPSVSPSENADPEKPKDPEPMKPGEPTEPVEPVELEPEEKEQPEVQEEPNTEASKPQMSIPELDDVMDETRTELREVARGVAEEKYASGPVDTLEKALLNPSMKGMRWGIIGSGQAGGRVAEQFYKFGYQVCVVNTAKQDMTTLNIPDQFKLHMDYGLGGAGKSMSVGESAITEYEQDVLDLMKKTFGPDIDTIVVCVGGGGGTGSGSVVKLVQMVARFGLPVVVLYTLPLTSEGSNTKANAIRALDRVARLSVDSKVNALVIVDNSKIEQLYPNVAAGQFWTVANFDIVNVLNMFNTLCRCDTKYDALDPMDFLRIFSTGNCTIFGKIEIPVDIVDGQVMMYEDELANQVLNNLQSGLLADGFNLQETVAGGVIVTGPEQILDQIPAVNINFMYHRLNELVGDANIYRGLYRDDDPRHRLTVYTILSGLGLPVQRVENLLREAQESMSRIEHKTADKSKMVVDTQKETTAGEKSVYDEMKQRSTAFGRLAQRRGKRRGPGRG